MYDNILSSQDYIPVVNQRYVADGLDFDFSNIFQRKSFIYVVMIPIIIVPVFFVLFYVTGINYDIETELSVPTDETRIHNFDSGIYFINSLVKISSTSRRKFKNLLKKGDLYMGASSLIELGGPSNNENKIVRVLVYNRNKMETIGYFNGTELVKNQSSIK